MRYYHYHRGGSNVDYKCWNCGVTAVLFAQAVCTQCVKAARTLAYIDASRRYPVKT